MSSLTTSHHVSSTDASALADIKDRIFGACFGEQSPSLRAARRKFLELNEVLEGGEKHGALGTKADVLLGWARTLELSAGADSTQMPLNISTSKTGEGGSNASSANDVQLHIEAKRKQVSKIPGITRHVSDQATCINAANEQCRLLTTHAQYISELASETELLARLWLHTKDHPIYEAARGVEMYFGGLIDSLSLKLKILAGDMHQALYSPSTTEALARLRKMLATKEAGLRREKAALDERLAIYAQAGSEFQDIASAYAAILKECDQVREDIVRLSEL
ncbi:hypothetical protein EV175_006227 [Coemansia sp. RSA 1933]|nr:hypothetical protein EV175_006227 [Coemansia sp. RSA 1933]